MTSWLDRALLAAFFIELANLFAIAVTQGTVQLVPLSADRFQSFQWNAAFAWLSLAIWEFRRRRRSDDPARDRYRLMRLAIVGLCLAGAAIYFRVGIRLGADGPNYFMQARSILFDRDIDFANEIEQIHGVVPGMPERAMGLPLLSMPFLVLAHVLVGFGTGFGYAYETAFGLASYVVGSLGVLAMFKTAYKLFPPWTALVSVVTVSLGSFLAWYMVMEPAMPHAVSAASVAFLIAFWVHRRPMTERRDWLIVGALVGLATLARWQNAVFGLLPLLDAFLPPRTTKLKVAASSALTFVLVLTPQILYWVQTAERSVEASMDRHQLVLDQLSVAEVLFSTNRGLFPWSPVLYLGFFGLLLWVFRARRLALLCLLGFAMEVYVNSSAEMWWGGWAFGGRRFDNSLVVFVLGFAALIEVLRRRPLVPLTVLCAGLVLWNVGLMRQLKNAEIEPDGNISFRDAGERNFLDYYDRLGFPGAWPANWLFARRFEVSPEKFDRLFGHIGFGNFRLPMDGAADAYLGRGWSVSESDPRGAPFRWALGEESTVLVPLKAAHRYVLSVQGGLFLEPSLGRVGLRVNGSVHPARRWGDDGTLSWTLEPDDFRPGVNELRFEWPGSAKPSDAGRSTDSRPLAARVYRVELIARDVNP